LCYKIRGVKLKILIYKKKKHEKLIILFSSKIIFSKSCNKFLQVFIHIS